MYVMVNNPLHNNTYNFPVTELSIYATWGGFVSLGEKSRPVGLLGRHGLQHQVGITLGELDARMDEWNASLKLSWDNDTLLFQIYSFSSLVQRTI